jgi:hypothetical protein
MLAQKRVKKFSMSIDPAFHGNVLVKWPLAQVYFEMIFCRRNLNAKNTKLKNRWYKIKILGTYLSEKFLEHPDEEVCTAVNNKLQEYMEAMAGLCREEASLIMCRSLTGMFKVLICWIKKTLIFYFRVFTLTNWLIANSVVFENRKVLNATHSKNNLNKISNMMKNLLERKVKKVRQTKEKLNT